jgi:hypothetical protein
MSALRSGPKCWYVDDSDVAPSVLSQVAWLARGIEEGRLYPGEIVTAAGRACVSHDWLLDYWRDVVRLNSRD